MGMIAVLLALAVVISMLMARGLHVLGPTPAGPHGVIQCPVVKGNGAQPQSTATPESVTTNDPLKASPISAAEFEATGVNSPSLITPLHVESKASDYDVTLLGAYADAARMVLIVQILPTDVELGPLLGFDDGGGMVWATLGVAEIGGDYVVQVDAGPRASAGRVAQLLVHPQLVPVSGNPTGSFAGGSFGHAFWKFDLPVQRSICFSPGAPFQLGNWPVDITMLEVTPSTIHIRALLVGASGNDLVGIDPLTAVDQNGTRLGGVAGGGVIAEGGWLIDYQWMRPVGAGRYRLLFQANGATHTVTLDVPASTTI